MNNYKEKCITHDEICYLFCPDCLAFRCTECNDPHYARIITPIFINIYSKALYHQQSESIHQCQIETSKNKMISEYLQAESKLRESFYIAVESLCNYAQVKENTTNASEIIKEMKLSDNAIEILNKTAADEITDEERGCKIKTFQHYMDLAMANIESIRKAADRFKNLQEILKHPFHLSTLHTWSGKTLNLYDVSNMSKRIVPLNKEINVYADSISYFGRIFVMGGTGPTADVFEIHIKDGNLMPRESMLCAKHMHNLCECFSYIYSIGGNHPATKDSEKYSITNNKWYPLPDLNTERHAAATFIFKSRYLFAFCGMCTNAHINTLERLLLSNPKKWEFINVNNVCSPRHCTHAIQFDSNKVLIIGSEKYVNESYIMTITENEVSCKKNSELTGACRFGFSSPPIIDGNMIYAVDNNKTIHLYLIEEKKWTVVKGGI